MAKSKPSENTTDAIPVAETAEVAEAAPAAPSKQGVAVSLPDGMRRIDYIKHRYYVDGVDRGVIAKELSEKLGRVVPYQIVFAGTKEEVVTIDGKEYTRERPSKAKAQPAAGEEASVILES